MKYAKLVVMPAEADVVPLMQEPHAFVDNAQQLIELFLFYFARGSSAER